MSSTSTTSTTTSTTPTAAPAPLTGPGKTGTIVLYQPFEHEFPQSRAQQAAIITTWDEDSEKADLIIFVASTYYTNMKRQVVEGTIDGTFQQFGVMSATAQAIANEKAAKQKAAEVPPSTDPSKSSSTTSSSTSSTPAY